MESLATIIRTDEKEASDDKHDVLLVIRLTSYLRIHGYTFCNFQSMYLQQLMTMLSIMFLNECLKFTYSIPRPLARQIGRRVSPSFTLPITWSVFPYSAVPLSRFCYHTAHICDWSDHVLVYAPNLSEESRRSKTKLRVMHASSMLKGI